MRLGRGAAALLQIARRTGGGDILPARPPAQPARDHMVEGQFLARPAILAGEPVAQEQVEPGEGRMLRRLHILRSEEHTSELQSLMRISYAVFCLKKKKT